MIKGNNVKLRILLIITVMLGLILIGSLCQVLYDPSINYSVSQLDTINMIQWVKYLLIFSGTWLLLELNDYFKRHK